MKFTRPGTLLSCLLLSCLLLSCVPLGACSPAPQTETPGVEKLESAHRHQERLQDEARFASSAGQAERPYDVLRYALSGEYDWNRGILRARLALSFRLFRESAEIELDSSVARVLEVRSAQGRSLRFIENRGKDPEHGVLQIGLDAESVTEALAAGTTLSIRYEVQPAPSVGFKAVGSRRGDPVPSRVVFTYSEPLGAASWMPCNNRPSDRALFSMEFLMPQDHSLIANGALELDRTEESGLRRMRYATRYTLPTYLMAFAAGEFVTATQLHARPAGALPISIWARKGIRADFTGLLRETARQIAAFERLLTPYPFEKYAVVLLPEFRGGIEHASITFNSEDQSSEGSLQTDLGLMAHELGHQWFGDWVTVRDWDDLWIKEGMATLLAAESTRSYEDQENRGRLFGDHFGFASNDAIRDKKLPPGEKYTSGPYARSAWFLTQLRARIGEAAFWGTLRKILDDHAQGTIGSEEFLEAFRPSLGEELFRKALTAIDAHGAPELDLSLKDAGTENEKITLSIQDRKGTLLAPVTFGWQMEDGSLQSLELSPGSELELDPAAMMSGAAFLIPDLHDAHPDLEVFFGNKDEAMRRGRIYDDQLFPLFVPLNSTALALFGQAPSSHQALALSRSARWKVPAERFLNFYRELDSEPARFMAIRAACASAKAFHSLEWERILRQLLSAPPALGIPFYGNGLDRCLGVIPQGLFDGVYGLMKDDPASSMLGIQQLAFLSKVPMTLENVLATWGPVGTGGPSVRSRLFAISAMTDALKASAGELAGRPDLVEGFRAYFREMLTTTRVGRMLSMAIAATGKLKDLQALGNLQALVLDPALDRRVRAAALCGAWEALREAPDSENDWVGFVEGLGELEKLPEMVRSLVEKPAARCPSMNRS